MNDVSDVYIPHLILEIAGLYKPELLSRSVLSVCSWPLLPREAVGILFPWGDEIIDWKESTVVVHCEKSPVSIRDTMLFFIVNVV